MRFGVSLLISAAVLLSQAPNPVYRWITRGPLGPVTALAADPQHPATVYAAIGDVYSGYPPSAAFRETDAEDWTKLAAPPPGFVITALALDPQDSEHVLAAAIGSPAANSFVTRIYRSTDGGATWLQMSEISGSAVLSLTVDPSDSQVVYGGGTQPLPPPPGCPGPLPFFCYPRTGALLFRSPDAGAAFLSRTIVAYAPAIGGYFQVEGSLDEVVIGEPRSGVLFARNGPLLLGTRDAGISWKLLNPPDCNVSAIAVDPRNGNELLVGGDTCGFLTSHDAGETFTPISPDAFPGDGISQTESVTVDLHKPAVLYAAYKTRGGQHFIAASRDAGRSWRSLEWPASLAVRRLAVDASGTVLYAAMSGGVYERAVPAHSPITVPFR